MRQLFALLVIVSFPLMAGTMTKTARFDRGDLLISTHDGRDYVGFRGGTTLVQPGSPRVPLVIQRVLVPAGAVPTAVEFVSADWTTIPGRHNLAPSQQDVPLAMPGRVFELPTPVQDPAVYTVDAYYPSSCIRLAESQTLAGYRMASVELRPVRVNPVSGELQLATRIEYRADHSTLAIDPARSSLVPMWLTGNLRLGPSS